jgi:hypothetical protein
MRVATVLFVLAASVSTAAAQGFEFGAKVGPSFTGIALDEDDGGDYHRRIAAGGGGFVTLPLGRRLAVQLEALSSPRGTRLEDAQNVSQTLVLRYLDVPILLRINGPKYGSHRLYAVGGPYTGIRLSAREQLSFLANSIKTGVSDDVRDAIRRTEHGFVAGAGLDIGGRMLIEGRYVRGLTNVNNVAGAPRFTNGGFSFMSGVRF